MERLWTITRKELLHIMRDPRTLALILLLPALLLVLLGFGVSTEARNIPLAVADLSKSDASRRLVETYTASGDFALRYDVLSETEILDLMDNDSVDVGLLIPESFGRQLDTGEPAVVQFYVNGSADPTVVQTTQLKLSAISQMAAQNILIEQIEVSGAAASGLRIPFEAFSRVLYNPNGENGLYMIPGLIPIILQVQALLLTTLAIVREREQGTMEQLIVTPIRSWELMLGKIIPYLLVGVLNTIALVWLGQLFFGVQVAGNPWELIGLGAIFIVGSLGMGVLISNLAQSQMQAVYLVVFIVIIPAIILSGLLFSRDNMPAVTFWYGEVLPVTHYLEITRGIMLRGVSAGMLWPATVPLLILSVIYFIASVLAFRKRI